MRTPLIDCQIIIDECVPEPLYKLFDDYNYFTILHSELEGKKNGELLEKCSIPNADVFITCDIAMEREQILKKFESRVPVVIFKPRTNSAESLKPFVENFITNFGLIKKIVNKGKIYLQFVDNLSECILAKIANDGRITIMHKQKLNFNN